MSSSLPMTPARKPVAPLVAFVLLLLGAVFLQNSVGSRQVLLLVVGAALGLTLYHAAFGFTSAWRVFLNDRRGAGLRAQMVMLAVAVLRPGAMLEHRAVTSLRASRRFRSRPGRVAASLSCPTMPANALRAPHAELAAQVTAV